MRFCAAEFEAASDRDDFHAQFFVAEVERQVFSEWARARGVSR
jgi:hypothetical protein